MKKKITRILFLNQMAGPLFRELAEDFSVYFSRNSILKTGHPDTLELGSSTHKLVIEAQPGYDRSSYFTRILSWVKYTLSVSIAMFKADKNTAIFIVSNPPLMGPAAWLVNKLKSVPYIVMVYDMHPDTMVSFGVINESSFVTKIWRWVNRKVWNNAEAVYTLGPVMAERLSSQFDASKTALGEVGVIPPWADTNKIKPIEKGLNPLAQEFNQVNKITVLYSGNMGVSHDIDSILQAAKLLREDSSISFLMIGGGEKYQDVVRFQQEHNLINLKVLPYQPEEKLPYTMPLADIALVAMDVGAENLMIPSKMFYYMAAGASVIGICSGRNDVSEIINKSFCGLTVEPNSPQALAESISALSNDAEKLCVFKVNARKLSESDYSRASCVKDLKHSVDKVFSCE
jgi:colanic acid biosynthesis glycosyl transferase WcaI